MKKLASLQIYLLGISLWMPAVALVNVKDMWGLQVAMVLVATLFLSMVLVMFASGFRIPLNAHISSELLLVHGVFLLSSILSTLFTTIAFQRSLDSLFNQSIIFVFSLSLSWWLTRNVAYIQSFLGGFKTGGFLSAAYAIYQVAGIRRGLPLAYLPINNASFSLRTYEQTSLLGRAHALTPEASSLASLLLPLLVIMLVEVLIAGGITRYLLFSLVACGYLATSSQSLVLVPFCVLAVLLFVWLLHPPGRKLARSDLIGVVILIAGAGVLVLTNERISLWLSRVVMIEKNASVVTRSNDMLVGLEMFKHHPLVGVGLGASSVLAGAFQQKLGIEQATGGISNTLFRILAEQGAGGMLTMLVAAYAILPLRMVSRVSSDHAVLLASCASFVVCCTAAIITFVVYRNLYDAWLFIPMGLSLKALLRQRLAMVHLKRKQQTPSLGQPSSAALDTPRGSH
ncbi:MAG: O-antigen ligase family protein [Chloroflexaceae bacterium]|nr:O-antigen ligase family protein [Chloroflexaceae bacterium]